MPVLVFALHLGVGPRTVSDWEFAGARIVPTLTLQAVLDTALSRADDEAKIRFAALAGEAAVVVPDSAASNGNGDNADRRSATKALGLGGLGVALFPHEAFERITQHGAHAVDAGLIAAHEDVADMLASLHRRTRPDVLLGQVAGHADTLYQLLDEPMGVVDRRRLEVVAVESHVQAGMLAFVAGQRATARRYYTLARDVAGDARDDALRALAEGVSSGVHSSIWRGGVGGDTERAVKLLRGAAGHAERADAKTRAWVHRWLAVQLAASGDERGFHVHMELGERPGSGRDRGYRARSLCDGADTVRDRGVGLVLLGRADQAIEAFSVSLVPGIPRQAVAVLTDTAAARVLQGEPEEACLGLRRALDIAIGCRYAGGVQRVLGVRSRLDPGLACAAELDEQLRLAHRAAQARPTPQEVRRLGPGSQN